LLFSSFSRRCIPEEESVLYKKRTTQKNTKICLGLEFKTVNAVWTT